MALTPEDLSKIRSEVAAMINLVKFGATVAPTDTPPSTETINSLYPGALTPSLPRPVMHPFGFASKAMPKTVNVVLQIGDHPGNTVVIGHRDLQRPIDLLPGEVAIYSNTGTVMSRVTCRATGDVEIGSPIPGAGLQAIIGKLLIQLGSRTATEPFVLGNVTKAMLISLLTQLQLFITNVIGHTHQGGNIPPPDNAAAMAPQLTAIAALQASPITDGTMFSKKVFADIL